MLRCHSLRTAMINDSDFQHIEAFITVGQRVRTDQAKLTSQQPQKRVHFMATQNCSSFHSCFQLDAFCGMDCSWATADRFPLCMQTVFLGQVDKSSRFFFFFFSRDQAFYKSFESLQFWARASKPLKGDIESKQKVMSWASLPLLRLENWSCSRCFKSSISFLHACQPQGGKNDSLCVVFLLVNQAEYLAPATLAPTQKCWKKSEKWSSFEDRFCVES